MTATEHELRAYLERRAARGTALTSAPRVLARAVPMPPRRRTLAPLLAAAATLVVVGGALSAGVALRRGGGPAPGQAQPRLVVPSTPPPAGVSLIWYGDPGNPARLVAVDWTGRPVGSLPIPADGPPFFMPTTVQPAPDGQHLLLDVFSDRVRRLVTAQGVTLATIPVMDTPRNSFDAFPASFSRDGSALCEVKSAPSGTGEASLYLVDAAHGERRITDLGPGGGPNAVTWRVADCSVSRDRAVLTMAYEPKPIVQTLPPTASSAPGWASAGGGGVQVSRGAPAVKLLRTVRLSDGATLGQRAETGLGWWVTTSPDGTLYAVNGKSGAVIRSVDSGAQVGIVSGATVLAFSAGDRLVMTSAPGTGGAERLDLLDWRAGTHVWSASAPLFEVHVRPDGEDFLVVSRVPAQNYDLTVVHADGTALRIASNVAFNAGVRCTNPCTAK